MFESFRYSRRAIMFGDQIGHMVDNMQVHAAEEGAGRADLDPGFVEAMRYYRNDFGTLLERSAATDATAIPHDLPYQILAGYQYIGLKHRAKLPRYLSDADKMKAGFMKIFRNGTYSQTLGESLVRPRAVSKPARYIFLPLVAELRGYPLDILDIGGASGIGPAYAETSFGRHQVAVLRQHGRLRPTRRNLDIRRSLTVDIQPPDDNWMLASSTLVGHQDDFTYQIGEALAVRNRHSARYPHLTGNIFDIMHGDEDLSSKAQLTESANVAVTSFVRHFDADTYPIEMWADTIAQCTVDGSFWFDMDKTNYDPTSCSYPVNVYRNSRGRMLFDGEFCRYGSDQHTLLPDTLNSKFV